MQLQFKLLSKLLSATRSLCYSAYLCLGLATTAVIFASAHTNLSGLYLFSIFGLCLLQHYLYVRVQFDADLLKIAAESLKHTPQQQTLSEFSAALDQALHQLGLIPQHKMGRNWALRQHACIRLFKFQFILLIMQYILFLFLIQHLI